MRTAATSDTVADVMNELIALHWTSHGKGATVAEIEAGLRAAGRPIAPDPIGARWAIAIRVGYLLGIGAVRRLLTATGDEVLRGDHVVFVPTEARP